MKTPKITVPSEHIEQVNFVKWFRLQYPSIMIFAIPNGGARHAIVGAKLKAEGVLAGVPDLFVPSCNLWIEMKRVKASYATPAQKDVHDYLLSVGHTVIIGYGAGDAIEKVSKFLALKRKESQDSWKKITGGKVSAQLSARFVQASAVK